MVSVIIPVGPGHEKDLINALDSLEAQTFKGWEAIVVWDSPVVLLDKFVKDSYPHVKWVRSDGSGPGKARNFGATFARGPLLAFLDADDYYSSEFLRVCVNNFLTYDAIIYTDFVSIIPKEMYPQPGMTLIKEREDGNLLVRAYFGDFDQKRAMQRPEGDRPYVWSGVTVLVPHAWHEQIGGFDEEMNTWEDCDYLLRLAWHGFVFQKVAEELWIYNFTSGKRRDNAIDNEVELITHLQMKYDKITAGQKELSEQALVNV
jgi:glycosyltransferase involved in cell wall biosynthesis